MANMRRRSPEPPAGLPQVQFRPGLADETLRELAPLLVEEGIDVDDIDVPDLKTLQQAMNRAVERHNMMRFTPIGAARDDALDVLCEVTDAVAADDTGYAADVLDRVPPDAPDGDGATVAGCIGVALGLLDTWLAAPDSPAPASLGRQIALPAGALDRRTRRHRHSRACTKRPSCQLNRFHHCSARRKTRPLRRRTRRRRRDADLVPHHRNAHP